MFNHSYLLPIALAAIFPLRTSAESDIQRVEIVPLLTSEWGQDAPFYYSTPTIKGQHCRTGCGATALSQVIYYHQYPKQPASGTYSYITSRLGTISFDFSKASFEYDVMKDSYARTDSEDDPAVKAVAELMFASGVVLNMDYDLTESSASFGSISSGLSKWFNYPDDGMKQLSRDYFTNDEWEQIIYDELKNGRPVLYLGGNGTSSHIFVCDGYKDGKFHMNWGWYGEKNGYFSLTNLQTERVVADGLLSLNTGQKIIIGVRSPEATAPTPVSYATSFGYDADSDAFSLSETATSYNNASVIPGIKATDANGRDYFFWNNGQVSVGKGVTNISYSVAFKSLPDGKYTLRPVYKFNDESTQVQDNEIFSVYCNPRKTRFFQAEISENHIISAVAGTDANINVAISEFSIPSTLIKGETYNASFSILAENNGNTSVGVFKLKFFQPDSDTPVSANEQSIRVDLVPGESKKVVMALPSNLPAGFYDMYVVDGTGGSQETYPVLSEPIRIHWRDNAGILKWEKYNLRVLALSDETNEAILLKNKPGAPTVPQGLTGELIIPETISYYPVSETMTLSAHELTVAEIGPQLVYNETGLTRVVIPSTVKNIGSMAFAGCSGMNKIEIEADIPPTLQTKVFDETTTSTATLVVPKGSKEAYKSAEGWKEFADIVEVSGGDELFINYFSIAPGGAVNVPVTLETDSHYYGCQFDLELPDDLSISNGGVTVSDSLDASEYTVSYSPKSENSYIFLLFSNNHAPFPTGLTDLLDITFQATRNFKGGTINITNIEFSADDGEVDKGVGFDSTSCEVTLDDINTSISEIYNFENGRVDVYNVSGVVINKNVFFDEIKTSLAPGLYILRNGVLTQKVMVR